MRHQCKADSCHGREDVDQKMARVEARKLRWNDQVQCLIEHYHRQHNRCHAPLGTAPFPESVAQGHQQYDQKHQRSEQNSAGTECVSTCSSPRAAVTETKIKKTNATT